MKTTVQNQNHSPNYGLLRFRSAPSSLFANFIDGVDSSASKGNPGEGSESRRVITRFMNYAVNSDSGSSTVLKEIEDETKMTVATRAAAGNPMNSQHEQSGLPPYYPRQNGVTNSSAIETSYGFLGSSLSRQNSSPAGFFSHIAAQNDYSAMRGVDSYGRVYGSEEDISPSSNRLKTQINFGPRPPSRLGILPDIPEIGDEAIVGAAKKLENNNGDAHFQGPGFQFGSLIESSPLGENFCGIKPERQNDGKLFTNTQSEKLSLSHQLSMPQTSSELLAIEKFLQFQDSVPCRIRAKRGCATHPRSIAERVRRTRISERMRKLQELVPNMDKQTNTADMLDLAVDYIKDLQKQFKTLSSKRANCECSASMKSVKDQII